MRTIISRNPYTGAILDQIIPFVSEEQIAKQLILAKEGYELQAKRTVKDRIGMLKDLIPLIQKNQDELAKVITFQTGKPFLDSLYEVSQSLKICNYYSSHQQLLMPYRIKTEAKKKTLIKYSPLGTILCLLPAHYPFLLTFLKVIPQLVIGNGVLVSPSHSTPRVAKAIDKLLKKGGFESGQYQILWNNHDQVELVLKRQQIQGVSFTGSEKGGRKVAEIAGRYVKKIQMGVELRSTLIVFKDGNVTLAIQNMFKNGYFCSGQGVSPKRIILHQSHFQHFKDKLIDKLNKMKIGDPMDKTVTLGPLQEFTLHQQMQESLSNLPSFQQILFKRKVEIPFFSPTVIQSEQTFNSSFPEGPVFQLIKAENDQHCILLANKNRSHSVCYLFSENKWIAHGDQIDTGCVIGNTVTYFDPQVPLGQFGAFSRDGWQEGVHGLCNVKTSFIN